MAGDRVQELCQNGRIEISRALLDHPQPEVDVAEQATLVGRPKRRPRTELADPADVVEESGREDEVVSQPGMELCGLAAERGDADRVLEEPARVAVMAVGARRRERAKRLADLRVADEGVDHDGEPLVGDLRGEELEEAVELVGVPAHRRGELGGVGVGGLDRAHLHLQLPAEPLHAAEDSNGVPLAEPLVEQVDVVPDPGLDATARIGELEREVRGSGTGAPALLPGDCEHALDGPVLDELGDRGHVSTI